MGGTISVVSKNPRMKCRGVYALKRVSFPLALAYGYHDEISKVDVLPIRVQLPLFK